MALPSQVVYLSLNASDPTKYDAKFSNGTVLSLAIADGGSLVNNVLNAALSYPGAAQTDQINIVAVSSNVLYNGNLIGGGGY